MFVVEDGTGLPDATSLASVEYADAHLEATGYASSWSYHDPAKKMALLNSGTLSLSNAFSFNGYLLRREQSMPFPRTALYDREGRLVIGIPPIVRMAAAEIAWLMGDNNYIQDPELAAFEKLKIGPIDLQLSDAAASSKFIPDSIIRLVSEYGFYRFGSRRMRRLEAG